MSRARGLQTLAVALCLSAAVWDVASAQTTSDPAPVAPQSEAADGSRPGWLLKGRGQNPFRVTPAPGTGALGRVAPPPADTAPSLSRLPPNAIPSPSAPGGWTCIAGFQRRAGQCIELQIPANAQLDLTGRNWQCNRGFIRRGQECVAIVVPENAALAKAGKGWVCNHGYRRQGQGCVAVVVPQNAALDGAGHNWVCNSGYVRRGQACLDDATARLQDQADKAVNARPAPAPAGQRPSVTINSGENRQGRTNKAKVVIGRF
jgi:hypothetical protein